MAALDTVAQYVSLARTLLQDTVEDYRYPDADLVLALSLAIPEAKKLRPDLFLNKTTQFFTTSDMATAVDIDELYRVPLVYYMIAHVQLRDDEEVQDQRAAAFLGMFRGMLTGT